ncbi:MAG: hypothetical protein WBQ23_11805 [Bacteroidota bacterium]
MLHGFAITLIVLFGQMFSGYAQGGVHIGIDKRLTGAWLLTKQSNIVPSGLVPPAINGVYIHDDGKMEGVGIQAAAGRLSLGIPLTWSLGKREILWADSTTLQFTQLDVQTKEPEIGDGHWLVDEDVMHLKLHNSFFGKWTEEYVRVSLGDSAAVPVHVRSNILVNGTQLHLVEVSCTPPGSVNVMQLDTATHMTIHFEGTTEDGRSVNITVRVHNINGPGVYPVEVEKPSGLMTVQDTEPGAAKAVNELSSGMVTIETLDLETGRCRGTLDVHYNKKFGKWPTVSPLHVTGSFDLPVWISTEYDIKTYQVSRPATYKEVVP